MTWNDYFLTLFDSCCATYRGGGRDFAKFYTGEDRAFLTTIGYQPREFFDFVEDCCEEGTPSASTALLVAAVRRDYFLTVQNGVTSQKVLSRDELPSFGQTLEGIAYLPRILSKARAKLRGELDPDIMFGCGGDRDNSKRPLMGAIAAKLADQVVLTSDNPRSEKPEAIIAQILLGLPSCNTLQVQSDRALAIAETIAGAAAQDVILLAGKGHEATQEIAGVKAAFSDRAHVAKALQQWQQRAAGATV